MSWSTLLVRMLMKDALLSSLLSCLLKAMACSVSVRAFRWSGCSLLHPTWEWDLCGIQNSDRQSSESCINSYVQILDDFAGDIDRDGIHYSILSGINFVKSLVDQSTELVKVAPPDPSARYQLLTDLLCDFWHAEYVAMMFHIVIY